MKNNLNELIFLTLIFITDIPSPFCKLPSFEVLVGQQKYLSEEDAFKLMKEFLALCKRHLRDQNQILKLEDIYKKTIVDYLKGIFYSKDTSDLQKLLDGLRKEKRNVVEGRQDSTTAQTFSLLKPSPVSYFGTFILEDTG